MCACSLHSLVDEIQICVFLYVNKQSSHPINHLNPSIIFHLFVQISHHKCEHVSISRCTPTSEFKEERGRKEKGNENVPYGSHVFTRFACPPNCLILTSSFSHLNPSTNTNTATPLAMRVFGERARISVIMMTTIYNSWRNCSVGSAVMYVFANTGFGQEIMQQ